MADIRRDVQEIQPANYVNPGVRKPSIMSGIAAVGSAVMDVDVALAKERLAKDAENLRTTYEVSAPGAQAVQDAAEPAPQLTAGDKAQISSLGQSFTSNQAAVDQGKMSFDEYRVRGERLLRMAISKRPGLAGEFRQLAALHLGTDVVGASVDVLASWEQQQLAALAKMKDADTPKPDYKRMRDQLDGVGIVNAGMTDEQVAVAYMENADAVRQMLVQSAKKDFVTTAADTQKAGQELNRPQATADFVNSVTDSKLEFYRDFSQGWAAIKTGQLTSEQQTQVINNGAVKLNGRVSELRMAMARGDVDRDIAEKEIQGLEQLGVMMTELQSGKLENTVLTNRMEGIMLYLKNGMLDNENVAVMSAATQVFGPEVMTQYVQPGGAFYKTGVIALGDTLNGTGTPKVKAQNAGSTASALVTTVLDRGGAKSNPAMVPAMTQTLANAGQAFVEMDTKDFKADYLTGPQGYLTVLWANRSGLSKALSPDQAQEVGGAAAMAAQASYQALAVSIGSKYPSLRGKLQFGLDPTTGDFIHPKGQLTPVESAALKQYNKAFDGKKIIQLLQELTGTTPQEAVALFGSSYQAYKESKDAQRKAKAKPAASAAGGSSGGNWWENF